MELGILIFSLYKDIKIEFPEIASQILRSTTSIGANIAESQSAESKKDFIHKLNIALKESRETYYWLKVLTQVFNNNKQYEKAFGICQEICALLSASIKTLQTKEN